MQAKRLPKALFLLGTGLFVIAATGAIGGRAASLAAGDIPRPSLDCYVERTLHAPAPFHLSWKLDDVRGHSDWEADITSDTIDGTWTNSTGARKIHGVRSDLSSWQRAFAMFPFGSETGHFRLVANNSAMAAKGQANVNGYSTMKYTVDTTHVPADSAAVFEATLGEKGSITGTAWVDHTGCVVKFIIDEAWQYGNGSLEKKHLDVGLTAKKQ